MRLKVSFNCFICGVFFRAPTHSPLSSLCSIKMLVHVLRYVKHIATLGSKSSALGERNLRLDLSKKRRENV